VKLQQIVCKCLWSRAFVEVGPHLIKQSSGKASPSSKESWEVITVTIRKQGERLWIPRHERVVRHILL
jgi:hypothetical protein